MKTSFNTSAPRNGGFTAVELLVIVIIIAVLAALLWPALFIAQAKSQAAQCLNNHKQLITAFLAYADSNEGNFPADEEGDQTAGDYGTQRLKVLPWVNGWENYDGGTLGSDTNTQFLVSPNYTSLGAFSRNASIYKCPADRSRQFGLTGLPRVRTVSMNQAVGISLDGTTDGIGGWLDGGGSPAGWLVYSNQTAVIDPSPANLFIFLDENPDSINDSGFAVENSAISDASARWIDVPAPLHMASTSFSFADGHADLHHWRDPLWQTAIDGPPTYTNVISQSTVTGLNRTVDLRWLGEHTSALKPGQAGGPWPWTHVQGQ